MIWHIWTDINNWPEWHTDLEFCKMNGPFCVGATFTLKPKGTWPVTITLTDIKEGQEVTDCTNFPGAKMYNTHKIEITDKGLKLSNTLVVTGILSWVWVLLVAKKVASSVPDEIDALVARVRKQNQMPEL